MINQQLHVRGVAVLRRDIERRRADIGQKMAPELDVRRIACRSAFFAERVLLPADTDVRVRAALQKLSREIQRRESAARQGRCMAGVPDAGGSGVLSLKLLRALSASEAPCRFAFG